MKKKLIVLAALIVICLSIGTYGTLAYFTASDKAVNVITAGNIKIDLDEKMVSGDTGELVVFENQSGIAPGDEVSKIVAVDNTGDNEAYVRVSVEKTIILADENDKDVDLGLISFDIDTEHWTEKDGYYYYNLPLESGKSTEPLFKNVIFSETMGNKYQNCKVTVTVNAEATQSANNGASAFEAAGWPEK